ncbi:MAG: N-acetylmuramoyl-L-alanine amidase [Bacteroidetes bacterium]|nr:N-acetylmuramoyl-L-alanine amidase [Bacteroidota bacterium]
MKRTGLLFGIFCMLLIAFNTGYSQQKLRKVVIDAGHGGKDPGAVGKNNYEKNIALSIALKTGKYIKENLPDVEVIYTRSDDRFVELHRRAQIANENKADLFVSIHCNANNSTSIYGTETYVMGLHRSQANLEVAKLENAAILKEEDYSDMYEGFDPNNDEDYITLSLFQNAFMDQSIDLASRVEAQFSERVGRKSRGVLQAGFLVLYKTAMPGVLIETGYISNPTEEKYLASADGQTYIASAIYRAIKEYKNNLDKEAGIAYTGHTSAPETGIEELPVNNNPEPENVNESEQKASPEVIFKVQVASSDKPLKSSQFGDIGPVEEYVQNGSYKYTAGKTSDLKEATVLQNKIRKNSKYKDAFVVAFLNGERISIKAAREMLGL